MPFIRLFAFSSDFEIETATAIDLQVIVSSAVQHGAAH
jgi:hypothetical protein